jgi:hypothetical protein
MVAKRVVDSSCLDGRSGAHNHSHQSKAKSVFGCLNFSGPRHHHKGVGILPSSTREGPKGTGALDLARSSQRWTPWRLTRRRTGGARFHFCFRVPWPSSGSCIRGGAERPAKSALDPGGRLTVRGHWLRRSPAGRSEAGTIPARLRVLGRRRTPTVLGQVDGAVACGGVTTGDGLCGPCANQAPRGMARPKTLPRDSTTVTF